MGHGEESSVARLRKVNFTPLMMDENYIPHPLSFISTAMHQLQVGNWPWYFPEPSSSYSTHIHRVCSFFDVLLEKY